MRVFVTGGTGLVGKSVIPALVSASHTVTALSRTAASDATLTSLGAQPVRGTLESLSVLASAAASADAILHAAFDHSIAFSGGMKDACKTDRAALSALGDALAAAGAADGRPRALLYTSGSLGLPTGGDEASAAVANEHLPRYLSEELVHSYAGPGVRAMVVRLPPLVHGPDHEHPFIRGIVEAARARGKTPLVRPPEGAADIVWAATHVEDLARLFVLALDKGESGNYHAIAEAGVPTREFVTYMAQRLGTPVEEMTPEVAVKELGFVGLVLSKGDPVAADKTKKALGWEPKEYGFMKALEGYPFEK